MNWFLVPVLVIVTIIGTVLGQERLSTGGGRSFVYWYSAAHLFGAFAAVLAMDIMAHSAWDAATAPEPNDVLLGRLYTSEMEVERLHMQIRVMERNAERSTYLLEEERQRPVLAVVNHSFPNFVAYDLQSPGDLYERGNTCPQTHGSSSVLEYLLQRPWGSP